MQSRIRKDDRILFYVSPYGIVDFSLKGIIGFQKEESYYILFIKFIHTVILLLSISVTIYFFTMKLEENI